MNLNSYTLSFKLSFIMIFGAGLSIIILVLSTFIFFNDYVESDLINTSRDNAQVIEKIVDDLQTKAVQISLLLANMEIVKEAYRNPDPKAGADTLMKKIKPIIENLKLSAAVDKIEIHFHKPVATSFLRVWTKKRGDDLSKFRKTILEVEKTKSTVKGIELGLGGFAIRGLAPIFDNGKYVGSCEMFYNPIDVINFLALDQEKAGALFLVDEKKALELFDRKIIEEKFKESKNGLFISNFSNRNIDSKTFLSDDIFNSLNDKENIVTMTNNYSVSTIPIKDFSGNRLGFFLLAQNVENEYSNMYKKIFYLVMIFFFTFTFVNISTLLIIRKTIIKPIITVTDMANKIAKGDLKI